MPVRHPPPPLSSACNSSKQGLLVVALATSRAQSLFTQSAQRPPQRSRRTAPVGGGLLSRNRQQVCVGSSGQGKQAGRVSARVGAAASRCRRLPLACRARPGVVTPHPCLASRRTWPRALQQLLQGLLATVDVAAGLPH
jgi:hypothetical protein